MWPRISPQRRIVGHDRLRTNRSPKYCRRSDTDSSPEALRQVAAGRNKNQSFFWWALLLMAGGMTVAAFLAGILWGWTVMAPSINLLACT